MLGGDDVFARIDPGAEEILQPQRHRGHVLALVEQAQLDVEAAVIERRAAVEIIVEDRVAERPVQPRQDLEVERVAQLSAHPGRGVGDLRVGLGFGGGHVDQPGDAIEVVGRAQLPRAPRHGFAMRRQQEPHSRKKPRDAGAPPDGSSRHSARSRSVICCFI